MLPNDVFRLVYVRKDPAGAWGVLAMHDGMCHLGRQAIDKHML